MRVLIAEDEELSRNMLTHLLKKWDYEPIITVNGKEAWEELQKPNAPRLAILDWMMPEMDGIDVCKHVRLLKKDAYVYILMLTAKDKKDDLVEALDAGADDFVHKPFNKEELSSRLKVGKRVVELETDLSKKITDLEHALNHVKQLQGLLPMCSYCKKVRDDSNYWNQIEDYLATRTDAEFSHGVCPDCMENIVKPEMEKFKEQRRKEREAQEAQSNSPE